MRFKHRALAALIALALCLTCCATLTPLLAVTSIAETISPELEIHASAEPDEFIAPGETQLTFELSNRSDSLLESVSLNNADGLVAESIGSIAPGAVTSYSLAHTLTADELDAGVIEYDVVCAVGETSYHYPVAISIHKSSAEPKVELLRQVSSTSATDGSSITVVYRVRNLGDIDITALQLTDPLGEFEAQLESLEAGADKVFLQSIQPGEDTASRPVLTYSTELTGEVYTTSLDELPLRPAQGMLDAVITAGRSMFSSDTAEVVLQLTNSGSIDYTDITVYDDVYGGVIGDCISVPAGSAPVEVAHSYPIREDSAYRWRITGKTSTGDRIDFVTNTANVYLDSEGNDPLLTVKASTSMPKISRAGYVSVRIELSNVGSATATHVVLREETLGELGELAVVPTGDPTVYELRCNITQSASLIFSAVYTDSYGQERIAASQPLEITIGHGGQMPEVGDTHSPLFNGSATQVHNAPLLAAMLIGACLVLAVLVIALVIVTRSVRKRHKSRRDAIRQRRREDMAKTAPFTPLRKKDINKK